MKAEVILTKAHRLLTGRPTCLLTTRYKGQVNAMSVAWVSPVSLRPPLLGICIYPACYTHDMLERSQELVLNIPGRALAEHVLTIGSRAGSEGDKLAPIGLTLDSGRRVEVPWIVECLAHIECVIIDRLTPGDHTLFVAEIIGAWAEEEAFNEQWLAPRENPELIPLVHMGGASFSLLGQAFQAKPSA